MYLFIDENPNSETAERVFSTSGGKKAVQQLRIEDPKGERVWCDVCGVEGENQFDPAQAIAVEDSGAGSAWLIFGGAWGLRFRPTGTTGAWSVKDSTQWGRPFLVLDISAEDIRFG